MATTSYTVTGAWSAGARYTAAADVDALLSNPSASFPLAFEITQSDTVPTVSVAQVSAILPQERQPVQLASGDRVWFASPSGRGFASVLV